MTGGRTPRPVPLVGIVVVNYNGGELTLRCLRSICDDDDDSCRRRVVLVDNASSDGVVDRVRAELPGIEIIESPKNRGFGGGNNLGFARLGDCDSIALINPDAVVPAGWLRSLIGALDPTKRIGAVMPKILLRGHYLEVVLDSETRRGDIADNRPLGVQVIDARVAGKSVIDRTQFVDGFWGWEEDSVTVGGRFRWTHGRAQLLVPWGDENSRGPIDLELTLACGLGSRQLSIRSGSDVTVAHVDRVPTTIVHRSTLSPVDVINSTGLELRSDGSTADRGFLEVDRGQFDHPCEIFGWSGAAVLIHRNWLEEVGAFDERLFLYSEDAELSWRARRLGWRHLFVPTSVVRHEHSAITGAGSPLTRHLAARNRLVVLTLHAPVGVLARAFWRALDSLIGAAWRDIVLRLASRRAPISTHLGAEIRVLGGFARMTPASILRRVRLSRRGRVSTADVMRDWGAPISAGLAK